MSLDLNPGDPLPPADHIVRHCRGSAFDPDTEEVTGTAFFVTGSNHTSVSVNWLEWFDGSVAEQLEALRHFVELNVTRTWKMATLNVGDCCERINKLEMDQQTSVDIRYEPTKNDPSHAGISGYDLEMIADQLAILANEKGKWDPAIG